MPQGLYPEAIKERSGPTYISPARAPSTVRVAREVRAAWPCGDGPFGRTSRITGTPAQKAGKRYERKVLKGLSTEFGENLHPSPWFKFSDESGQHYCQPDAVFFGPEGLVVFEVKIRIVEKAWWQLRRLYEPVVSRAYRMPTSLCLICKHVDPAVPFPERYELIPSLSSLLSEERDRDLLGVYQWTL